MEVDDNRTIPARRWVGGGESAWRFTKTRAVPDAGGIESSGLTVEGTGCTRGDVANTSGDDSAPTCHNWVPWEEVGPGAAEKTSW